MTAKAMLSLLPLNLHSSFSHTTAGRACICGDQSRSTSYQIFRPVFGECLQHLYCATDQQGSDQVFSEVYRAGFASDMGRAIRMHLDLTAGVTVTVPTYPTNAAFLCVAFQTFVNISAPMVRELAQAILLQAATLSNAEREKAAKLSRATHVWLIITLDVSGCF